MKTIKHISLWVVAAAFMVVVPTRGNAQTVSKTYFNVDWQFNAPMGNSYADKASGWGMNFEGGYYVMPHMAIGAYIAYHTNNKYIDRQTLALSSSSALTTDQQHSLFQLPFGLLAKYRFTTSGMFEPYMTVKMGANYSRMSSYMQAWELYRDTWGFTVSPEIGISIFPSPNYRYGLHLAMYYNNYFTMGSRECQLGIGMNISNVGSKISYFGDDRSQFLPANLRLGASVMIPIDEYNRFSIAADASKLLVPTVPVQNEGESSADYQARVIEEYSDMSSITGIFKSFGDAPGGFKEELEEIQWSVGAEYVYHDQFSVRAGYHHESENKGNRKYFTVGGGFRMSVFSLDVGYVISTAQSNPLDQTLRFSLAFDMDGIKDLFSRR